MEAQQKEQVPHRAAWTALSAGFGLVSCAAALGMATHPAPPPPPPPPTPVIVVQPDAGVPGR